MITSIGDGLSIEAFFSQSKVIKKLPKWKKEKKLAGKNSIEKPAAIELIM